MKFFFLLLFATFKLAAQQMPEYVVYLVKGDVMVQKNNSVPEKVKQHRFLYRPETLILKPGAEVTLSNKDGISFHLKAPQSYPVSSIAKLQANAGKSVTQKYLNLLYHELLDPNHDYNKFKKENAGGVWGGVQRSSGCGNLLFPSAGAKISDEKVPFTWRKTAKDNDYQLTVYDEDGNELKKIAVQDTLIELANEKLALLQPGKYYWKVQSTSAGCEDEVPQEFEIISPEEKNRVDAPFIKLTSLSDQLEFITFLENAQYILLAKKHLKTLADASGNTALRKTYAWFLLRHHFDKEAEETFSLAHSK